MGEILSSTNINLSKYIWMFVTCWKFNQLSNILLWVLSVCKTPIISKVWRLGDDARISSGHCGLRWGIIGQNSPCFYLPLYIVFVEIHLHGYIWWNENTQLEHIAMWSQKVHYWPEWPLPYLPSLSAQLAVTKPHHKHHKQGWPAYNTIQ